MKTSFLCIISLFASLLQACTTAPEQVSASAVSIPLGGNTFITSAADDPSGQITKDGIADWTDESEVYSIFFRTTRPGKMSLFLTYDAGNDSEVKATCGGSVFGVRLHAGTGQTVFIGSTANADTGYVRVDLQGVKRKGGEYARASALLVDGEVASAKMYYVADSSLFYWGRRGPSVHLNYPFPEGENIEWFYNEVTVPVGEDPIGSYYMANGFGEGYFGIQVNATDERRILFSVWSPFNTDNPKDIPENQRIKLLKKGEGVYTGEFGNEGSGGQSYLVYPWITGNTYKFLTRVRPNGKGATEYTAYFFAPETGKWRLVAQFLRPQTDTWYKRAHSFLESFHPEYGYIGRKALYGNQWARTAGGRWIEITSARFTADNTARKKARMDYKGGVANGQFFLQNCGFLNDDTPIGAAFTRPAGGVEPVIEWGTLE